VVYHPRVPSEIREINGYYDQIDPALANEFWEELLGAIEYARAHPERHHFDPSGYRRSNLKRFPHHFLFKVYPNQIRIIVVRHNRRNPSYGTRRRQNFTDEFPPQKRPRLDSQNMAGFPSL
jgi:plasmid stabilization system protein ParE